MMNKEKLLSCLKSKIGAMRPEKFEEFCVDLLSRDSKYKDLEPNITPEGKTRKGPADAYKGPDKDNKYIIFLFTTKKDKKQKILDDIRKSKVHSEEAGIKIKEVVICTNRPLRIGEDVEYRRQVRNYDWDIRLFSVHKLADTAIRYPDILSSKRFQIKLTPDGKRKEKKDVFFMCGERLKKVREIIGLGPSYFVELIEFKSERELLDMEAGKTDVPKSLIERVYEKFGASPNFLKHGEGTPFEIIRPKFSPVYLSDEFIRQVRSYNPKALFLTLSEKSLEVGLVLEIDDYRYITFSSFLCKLYIKEVGSTGQSMIMEFYWLINKLHHDHDIYPSIYGRILPEGRFNDLHTGKIYPKFLTERDPKQYWAEDLLDVKHEFSPSKNYESYGEWFIELQSFIKSKLKEDK